MSKALEIVEERFAKGEIQKEEFEAIKAQLQRNETPSVSVPPTIAAPAGPAISKNGAALWIVLACFVIMAPAFLNLNDLGWRLAGIVAMVFSVTGLIKLFFGK